MGAGRKPAWIRWWLRIPLPLIDICCAIVWTSWIAYQLYVYRDGNALFLAASATPMVFISVAYLTRVAPTSRADKPAEILIPAAAALLPHAIVWLPVTIDGDQRLAANIIMMVGFVATAVGYATLRKSFSVLVDARPIVTAGPYRFMRHPIYLGQFVIFGAAAWRAQLSQR